MNPAHRTAIIVAKARMGAAVLSNNEPLTGPVIAAVAMTTATSIEPRAGSSSIAMVTNRIAVLVDSVAMRATKEIPRKRISVDDAEVDCGWAGVLMLASVL